MEILRSKSSLRAHIVLWGVIAVIGFILAVRKFKNDIWDYDHNGCNPRYGECLGYSWSLAFAMLVVGLVLCISANTRYHRLHVRLAEGIVIDKNVQTEAGYTRHTLLLEGTTLAGEKTTYWREVPWNVWTRLQIGDSYKS